MQEVVFVEGQELYPFKPAGIERIQHVTDEVDHLRHRDPVNDPVWLRVQSVSRLRL